MEKQNEYLIAGKIISTYSFRGEVKIFYECDSVEFFKKIKVFYLSPKSGDNSTNQTLETESVKAVKNSVVVKFKGIDTEDGAKKLIGKKLYFEKSKIVLPDDTFFIDDLLGLSVFDADDTDKRYGVLDEVFDNGSQLVFSVRINTNSKNKQILIPNVKQFVKKISLEGGIFVKLIDGMIDEISEVKL